MTTVDIIELGLNFFGVLLKKTRLDVRMSVSIVIKFIFFGIWFYVSGDEKYYGGHFATTLLTWVVFHLYIILIEMRYIVDGENEINFRLKSYKTVDSIQTGILIIYFSVQVYAYNSQSVFSQVSLTGLFVDITLNFDQMLKFLEKEKAIQNNLIIEQEEQGDAQPNIYGGEFTLYISMMIGAFFAMLMAIIMLSELQEKEHLQTFPFYIWSIIFCAIGESVFICFVAYYLLPIAHKNSLRNQARMGNCCQCSLTKNFLCLMYGLSIGFFSLYYAFLLGVYALSKIIIKILEAIGWLSKNQQNQVHPE